MRQESETFCAGYSLAEVMVVVVIMGVVGALAVPAMGQWLSNQRLQDSARSLESAFEFARGEAIRTGNIHLVLFDQDPDGNDIVDGNGDTVSILV